MEEYVVEVVNLTQGKLYHLSKSFFDRAAACVYGQDYVRDHRQENKDLIYFRVVVKSTIKSFTPVNFNIDWWGEEECSCSPVEETPHPEELTCGIDCDRCPDAWECDDAFYMNRKSIDRDDIDSSHSEREDPACQSSCRDETEEPSSDSLAEILSVFNAIRPNY